MKNNLMMYWDELVGNIVLGILGTLLIVGAVIAVLFGAAFIVVVTILSQKEFWYLVIIGLFIYAFM